MVLVDDLVGKLTEVPCEASWTTLAVESGFVIWSALALIGDGRGLGDCYVVVGSLLGLKVQEVHVEGGAWTRVGKPGSLGP